MTSDFSTVEAQGIKVTLDLRVGHIRALVIETDGRTLEPLHTAPWVDDPAITADESIPPNLRYLSGDFFCAPFGASDVEPAPLGLKHLQELERAALQARVFVPFQVSVLSSTECRASSVDRIATH